VRIPSRQGAEACLLSRSDRQGAENREHSDT
jgi:hypothetical protein